MIRIGSKAHEDYAECLENFSISDFGEYYLEIHDDMRRTELQRHVYHKRSPQLSHRSGMINFLREISAKMGLSRTSLHLGVYIEDIFMDNFEVAVERLMMFGAVCLIIGAKIEDKMEKVPHWEEIQTFLKNFVPSHEYVILECMILHSLNWKVVLPTTASFLEYYIHYSITEDDANQILISNHGDESLAHQPSIFQDLKSIIFNLAYFLLDLSLDEISFIEETPSKIASAIVLCSRFLLGYNNVAWTDQLKSLTKYTLQDIQNTANILRKLYKKSTKKEDFKNLQYQRILSPVKRKINKPTVDISKQDTQISNSVEETPPTKIFKFQFNSK